MSSIFYHQAEKNKLYDQIHHINNNLILLDDNDKAKWLLSQEDKKIFYLHWDHSYIIVLKKK